MAMPQMSKERNNRNSACRKDRRDEATKHSNTPHKKKPIRYPSISPFLQPIIKKSGAAPLTSSM
jgi:hypothetical protein